MKSLNVLACFLISTILFVSCGKTGREGTKFAPTEKESTMSEDECKNKLAEKKVSLNVSLDSILNFDGVKFSVIPPATGEGVTQAASELLATKIINIAAANGIGGITINPVLGLVTKVDCTESAVTATAPQKTVVKYELTLYCGNFISNDIYASSTQSVTGVGADLNSATLQAFSEVHASATVREMFRKASDKALVWYNNQSNISLIVDQAIADNNYALAMALLSSVPAQASTHEYAVKRNAEISEKFFQSKADELYSKMKIAITASDGEYNPEAGAYYSLIPHDSKIWQEADKVFNEYCKALDSDRRDVISRARAVEDRDARNAHLLEMEKLQVEKIKAPYEAQAAIAQIEADARVGVAQAKAEGKKNANTGGFLGLGKLWDGGFNFANRILNNILDE